jgi:putative oxidoreductase
MDEGWYGSRRYRWVPYRTRYSFRVAVLLIIGEVVGGVALILGVATRFWAGVGVIISLVALFTVHLSKGFLIGNGGYEFILLIGAVMLSLVFMGAGKYSVDAKLGM